MKPCSYFLVLFICICPEVMRAQGQVNFRHISSRDGLSSNSATALFRDSRGFMWIGTNFGLNRYDGTEILRYEHDRSNPNSLPGNYVYDLAEDREGRIWVGTDGGLGILDPQTNSFMIHRHARASEEDGMFGAGVLSLARDGRRMFMGTRHGVFRSNELSDPEGRMFDRLVADVDSLDCVRNIAGYFRGRLFFSTYNDFYFSDDGIRLERADTEYPELAGKLVTGLFNDGDSALYVASSDFQGIYKIRRGGEPVEVIPVDFPAKVYILSIVRVNANELWIGTFQNGVIRIGNDGRMISSLLPDRLNPASLSDFMVYDINVSRQGVCFVSTSRGVDFTTPRQNQFTVLRHDPSRESSIPERGFENYEFDEEGNIWIAQLQGDLYRVDRLSGRAARIEVPDEFGLIWQFTAAREGFVLAADRGMFFYDRLRNSFSAIGRDEGRWKGYHGGMCHFILNDGRSIWKAAYNNGMIRYDWSTGETEVYSPKEKDRRLPAAPPNAATSDGRGGLWVAFSQGSVAHILADGRILNYEIGECAGDGGMGYVRGLALDRAGNIWVGTSKAGVLKYDPSTGSCRRFDRQDGLSCEVVSWVTADSIDNLWITTVKGLYRLHLSTERITQYDVSDGLPSADIGAITTSPLGQVILGCDRDIVLFHSGQLQANPYLPDPFIQSIVGAGNAEFANRPFGTVDIDYREKSFLIRFGAINYFDPEKNQFAYKLEGWDQDWVYSGSLRTARYTNLPPGTYEFMVKCTNAPGNWEVQSSSVMLNVRGPFWKSAWFIVLACIALGGLIWLTAYIYTRQKLKLERLRNSISMDLHDEIGSTLSSISINSEVVRLMTAQAVPEAQPILSGLGERAREAMERMSDIIWAINPENDQFENVLERLRIFAVQFLGSADIRFVMDIKTSVSDQKLTMNERKNVYLILKEAVTNVGKYSHASACTLRVESTPYGLIIAVSDDGVGIDRERVTTGGNGIRNMRQRAAELNALFTIGTSEGGGTEVVLQLKT